MNKDFKVLMAQRKRRQSESIRHGALWITIVVLRELEFLRGLINSLSG